MKNKKVPLSIKWRRLKQNKGEQDEDNIIKNNIMAMAKKIHDTSNNETKKRGNIRQGKITMQGKGVGIRLPHTHTHTLVPYIS